MSWQTRQRLVIIGLLLGLGLVRLVAASDPIARPVRALVAPVQGVINRLAFEHEPAPVADPTTAAQIRELQAENDRLRQALDFTHDLQLETIGADIIQKDVSSFRKFMTINRGAGDGVRDGQAVVAGSALVGVVERVEAGRSVVRLIGDPQFRVTASSRGSKAHGIIKTVNGSLVFDLVPDSTLSGTRLLTDGLDGRFQAGLPLGEVGERLSGDDAVFQRYRIVLPVNSADLSEVLIVRGVAE